MSEQKGIGLAEALVRQLHRYVPSSGAAANSDDTASSATQANATTAQLLPLSSARRQGVAVLDRPETAEAFNTPRDFVRQLWPHAQQAADELGVDPGILIAQAALETGWGKAVSRDAQGKSSHNLFNIKADSRWDGPAVTVNTLEYKDGMAKREVARFRAYDSYAESFNDYVDFLKSNNRYQNALGSANTNEFVKELHAAGYATDPRYADKVLDIFGRDSFRTQLTEVQDEARV
jgi:flagellar protein FlgJ